MNLLLRRFQATVLINKSVSDPAQVPGDSATVTVYKQGATVAASTGQIDFAPVAVTVVGTGKILAGDNLQVGVDGSQQLLVDSVDSATQITVHRVSAIGFSLGVGDRLVVYSKKADLFDFADATGALSNPLTLGAEGLIAFYCPESRFDYIVTQTGVVPTLFIDNEAGWENDGISWVNAKNGYATFQAAIDATPDGGTLFIPAGTYTRNTVPAVVPMTITKRIHIKGEGRSDEDAPSKGTLLQYKNFGVEDVVSHLISVDNYPATNSLYLEDFTLEGPQAAGSGVGLRIGGVHGAIVRNINIRHTAGPCMSHELGTAVQMVHWQIDHCRFDRAYAGPLIKFEHPTDYPAAIRFHDCDFINDFGGRAVSITGFSDNLVWDTCTFQTSQPDSADAEFVYIAPTVAAKYAYKPIFQNCYIDWVGPGQGPTPTSWMFKFVGAVIGAQITGTKFTRNATDPAKKSTSIRFLRVEKDASNRQAYHLKVTDNFGILAGAGGTPTSVGTDDIYFPSTATVDITLTTFANNHLQDATSLFVPLTYTFGDANSSDPLIRLGDQGGRLKPRATGIANWGSFLNKLSGDIIFDNTTGLLRCYSATDGEFHAMWPYFQAGDPPTGLPSGSRWCKGDQVVATGSGKLFTCTVAGTIGGAAPTFVNLL